MWAELATKILVMIGRGRVKLVNDSGRAQTMQVQLNALETTDDKTPRIAEYGFSSNPPADSDAVLLYLNGDRTLGVVIGTNHQASRPTSLKPGESILFDNLGQRVFISKNGIVVEGIGLPITINSTASVTLNCPQAHLTGDLLVDGNINSGGNVSDATGSMAQIRTTHTNHQHTVGSQTSSTPI